MHEAVPHRDAFGTSSIYTATSSRPVFDDQAARENATAAASQRKSVTFFRFHCALGQVAVQPVVGSVKGAQLSIGF